ncbi:MAG: ATP-binding protein, partial [Salinibacter sp.]
LANLPPGVLAEDTSRRIIAANEGLCDALGLSATPGELEGQNCVEAAEEVAGLFAEPEQFPDRIEEILSQGDAVSSEELVLADGRILERDFVPYQLPDGRAALWLYRDITARKRRKQKLERQNDLFAKAQEIASVGAWEYNVDTEDLRWTQEVYRIHGRPPENPATLDEALSDYHPEDRPVLEEAFARATDAGESYDLELRLRTETEEERWVRTRGEPQHEDGKVVRLRGTIQDITEQRRRERALQRRRQVVESLYDATGSLLRAERREAVFHHIHEVLRKVFDYPFRHTDFVEEELLVPEQTEATEDFRLSEPEPRPTDGDTVAARALQAGEGVVVEHTEASDHPMDYGDLRAAAGVPIGERGVIVVGKTQQGEFDPTDLRLLEVLGSYAALVLGRLDREQALQEAKEEAEAATQMKSSLLANMSHEIRTPLTSIIGFAEALGAEANGLDLPDDSSLPKYANLIEQSGRRLMKTLDGVLNLSQLEAGQMNLGAEPVALADQVRWAAEELGPKARKNEIDLCPEVEDIHARADEGGVQIVLRNLLSNAIRYTEEEGTVWIRAFQEAGRAVLQVEDTGIGMESETVESIFKPFRQASEGRGRAYEGTGVGLAVTKEATKKMEGDLEVETEKGEGSRFTVRLPQAEEGDEKRNHPTEGPER